MGGADYIDYSLSTIHLLHM